MKLLLLLACLATGPLNQGGNDGGVGRNLPLDIFLAYTGGHEVWIPTYGDVYVHQLEHDREQCSIHVVLETTDGHWIEDEWSLFLCI